jgi:hypothetical protein
MLGLPLPSFADFPILAGRFTYTKAIGGFCAYSQLASSALPMKLEKDYRQSYWSRTSLSGFADHYIAVLTMAVCAL